TLGSARMDLGLVAELPRLLRVHASLPEAHRGALTEGVTTLATGMARYAARSAERAALGPGGRAYLDTQTQPEDYVFLGAGCLGGGRGGGVPPPPARGRVRGGRSRARIAATRAGAGRGPGAPAHQHPARLAARPAARALLRAGELAGRGRHHAA